MAIRIENNEGTIVVDTIEEFLAIQEVGGNAPVESEEPAIPCTNSTDDPVFKVGDKVMILDDGDKAEIWHAFGKGDIGTIIDIGLSSSKDRFRYDVEVAEKGVTQAMFAESIELYEEPTIGEPTKDVIFEKGDFVVVKDRLLFDENVPYEVAETCYAGEKTVTLIDDWNDEEPVSVDDVTLSGSSKKVEGAKYIVVNGYNGHDFGDGELVTLVEDDGSHMPLFENELGGIQYVDMNDVKLLEDFDEDSDYISPEVLEVGDRFTFESCEDTLTFDFTPGKEYIVTKGHEPRVVIDDSGFELFDYNFDQFKGIKLVNDDVKSEMDYSELTEIDESEVQDGDFIVFTENTYVSSREFVTGKLYKVENRHYKDENGQSRGIASRGHERTVDVMEFYRKINDSNIELEDGDIVVVTDGITDFAGDSVCSGDVAEVVSTSNKDVLYLLVPGSSNVRLYRLGVENHLSKVALVCKAKDRLDL